MWSTEKPCYSRVEYGATEELGEKAHTIVDGQVIANNTLNRITPDELDPGRTYFYKICSREILSFGAYKVTWGETEESGVHSFRTISPNEKKVTCAIFNDLHDNHKFYQELARQLEDVSYDFSIFNGDCYSDPSQEQSVIRSLNAFNQGIRSSERPVIHHVGEIMKTLEHLDLADNTILVFSSDNGGAENDVSSAGKGLDLRDESHDAATKARTAKTDARVKFGHRTNGNLRGHKGSNFEGGFRVPFIVRWPGKVAAGSESSQVIALADMLATSAGILGKKLPESAGGDSFDLSPVLMGRESAAPIRTTTILQTGSNRLAFRQGNWKIRCSKQTKWTGKKAQVPKEGIELYHLPDDPAETTDLAGDHPERVAAMRKLLMDLIAAGRSR